MHKCHTVFSDTGRLPPMRYVYAEFVELTWAFLCHGIDFAGIILESQVSGVCSYIDIGLD